VVDDPSIRLNSPMAPLKGWRKQDPLLAKHLDESPKAINRILESVQLPEQVTSPGVQTFTQMRQFRIVSIKGDYLFAEPFNGVSTEGGLIKIAKPFLLRRTPFDGTVGRNGFTFVYTTDTERVSTKTSDSTTEIQVIVPSYVVKDVIFCIKNIDGGTGVTAVVANEPSVPVIWIDMNLDGRFWAKKTE